MASPSRDIPAEEDVRDLGFGSRVARGTSLRFLNRDGTFNVRRTGLPFFRSVSLYQALITMPWARFYAVLVGGYVVANLLFAIGYLLCGPGALQGSTAATGTERFEEAFFFSVQTLATIGYGRLGPAGLAANLLVAVEALVGLLGVAFATGLTFGRFSRPYAQILFSERAVMAPYRGGTGFMFRMVNQRKSQLIQVRVTVSLSHMVEGPRGRTRKFVPLALERDEVVFFPLHWTVVHPIDEKSPLGGATAEDLRRLDAELLVLVVGTDETFAQVVHARTSYKAAEIVVGAKFRDIFDESDEGRLTVDVGRLSEIEEV